MLATDAEADRAFARDTRPEVARAAAELKARLAGLDPPRLGAPERPGK